MTCGRHLGSDCDDDHISSNKAEERPNSANYHLGKLRRSARNPSWTTERCTLHEGPARRHTTAWQCGRNKCSMSCQSSVCEFAEESVCGTRHRSGTCGKTRHLVRPRHSKESVEVCPLSRPCGGVEQVGEWLAGPESARRGDQRQTHTEDRRTDRKSLATHRTARSTGGNRKTRRERRWLQHPRTAGQHRRHGR